MKLSVGRIAAFLFVGLLASSVSIAAIFFSIDKIFAEREYVKRVEQVLKKYDDKHFPSKTDWEQVIPKYEWPWHVFVLFYFFQTLYWFVVGIVYKKIFVSKMWLSSISLPVVLYLIFFDPLSIVLSSAAVYLGGSGSLSSQIRAAQI